MLRKKYTTVNSDFIAIGFWSENESSISKGRTRKT
jgi:hypothetical protein